MFYPHDDALCLVSKCLVKIVRFIQNVGSSINRPILILCFLSVWKHTLVNALISAGVHGCTLKHTLVWSLEKQTDTFSRRQELSGEFVKWAVMGGLAADEKCRILLLITIKITDHIFIDWQGKKCKINTKVTIKREPLLYILLLIFSRCKGVLWYISSLLSMHQHTYTQICVFFMIMRAVTSFDLQVADVRRHSGLPATECKYPAFSQPLMPMRRRSKMNETLDWAGSFNALAGGGFDYFFGEKSYCWTAGKHLQYSLFLQANVDAC